MKTKINVVEINSKINKRTTKYNMKIYLMKRIKSQIN